MRLIAGVLFLVFSSYAQDSGPRDRAKSENKSDAQKDVLQSTQQPPVPTIPNVHSLAQPSPSPGKPTGNNSDGVWKRALGPETWSSWLLVLTAVVGTHLALRSLRALEKQVSANAQSAESGLVQAKAAIRAAETAEKTLLLTERADILIDSAGFSTYPADLSHKSSLILAFKNFGRTRGSSIETKARLGIPGLEEDMHPLRYTTVLGASDIFRCAFPGLGDWMTKETFLGIRDGAVQLRFEAEITYLDVFGFAHCTKCSGVFHSQTRTFVIDHKQEAD